ncbi:MAG: RNA methyltransferase [Flammeovirgaceae bacterium]|nr:RNA methyltransferase [Flammeovirgaceae bacterium]
MKKLKLEELGRISVKEFEKAEKIPVCIVLDNVRSMHNVGSVFRTADAFRIEKIILTGITGTPPHREIHKTALGATESVAWTFEKNPVAAIEALKKEGYMIIAIEQTSESQSLQTFQQDTKKKYCLVFGNEVNGVSDSVIEMCDYAIEVPQAGTKHSLNISVCVGVVVWEFFQKFQGQSTS